MKIVKRVVLPIALIILRIISIFIFMGYQRYKEAIDAIPLDEKIAEIESDLSYIKIDELPQIYIDAVVSAEDHRFYEHGAIDLISIGRAIFTNIKEMRLIEGGSTITQQLAKNTYFTQERTLMRKISEVFMAMKFEKELDKNKILELYVNTSYFGDGYYGIKDACNGYYKKEPIDMTLYEATLLAGIPNAPSIYAPTKNLDLAEQRQKQVIYKMIENDKLTEVQASAIIEQQNLNINK